MKDTIIFLERLAGSKIWFGGLEEDGINICHVEREGVVYLCYIYAVDNNDLLNKIPCATYVLEKKTLGLYSKSNCNKIN